MRPIGAGSRRTKLAVTLLAVVVFLAGCGAPAAREGKGLVFGPEQRVGRQEHSPAWPFLRVGPDGRLYMAWTELNPAQTGAGGTDQHSHGADDGLRSAYMAASVDGGKTWTEPVQINDKPENVQGDENEPKLAFGPGGRVYALWAIPNDKGDKMRGNIRFAMLSDQGRFTPARTLNEVPHTGRFPALQVAPDGTVYATWIDRRVDNPAPRQIYMTRISPSGTVLTSNYKIADDSCECCRLTMAFAGNGKTVYVAYRQKPANNLRNIVVRKSTDGGATFGEPVVVSDDGWQISACPHSGAVMAADAQGHLHIAWYTYGRTPAEAGIYYSVSRDGGNTFSPRRLIHAAGGPEIQRPYLAVGPGGEVYMAWTNLPAGKEQGQIFFRYLAADGETLSPVQQVSQAAGNAMWPNLAVSNDRVYLAWTEWKGETSWVVLKTAPVVG